jgi:hypothetical protein
MKEKEPEIVVKERTDIVKRSTHHGIMGKECCPDCGSRLMINWAANKWCSNIDCEYHIRYGVRVSSTHLKRLNNRFGGFNETIK